MYQARDDESPVEGKCASKFLFTAERCPREREGYVDADIELSLFQLSPGEDMRKTVIENFERQRAMYANNGIKTSISKEGTWIVGGIGFTHIDQENESRSGHSRYRFFFQPLPDALWLYGKIAGHKPQAYIEALEVVEGLTFTEPGGTGVRARTGGTEG
jgi:hypothetical protein